MQLKEFISGQQIIHRVHIGNLTIGLASSEVTYTSTTIYKVSYNDNDAIGGTVPAAQAKFPGKPVTIAANSGNLTGSSGKGFNGWNTKADGTGTPYEPGASYSADESITLYAQWVENPAAAPTTEVTNATLTY